MRRLAAIILAAALAAVWVAPACAGPADAHGVAVRSVDTSGYPSIVVDLLLPASLQNARGPLAVSVKENGVERPGATISTDVSRRETVDVVLVVDTSGSMKGGPLDAAKGAVTRFIGGMRPGDRIALVAFGDTPAVVVPLTGDHTRVLSAAEALGARGETALYDALTAAAAVAAGGTKGRTNIVLLSDGGDTVSSTTLDTAYAALRRAGAPVFAVALRSPEYDGRALSVVASRTGGRFASVADARKLADSFGGFAKEIRSVARVTFTSADPNTKDLDIDVTVRAAGQDLTVAATTPNPRFDVAGLSASDSTLTEAQPPVAALVLALVSAMACVGLAAYGGGTALARRRSSLKQVSLYSQTVSADAAPNDPDSLTARVTEAVDVIAARRGLNRVIQERLDRGGIAMRSGEFIALHLSGVVIVGALAGLAGGLAAGAIAVVVGAIVPILLLDQAVRSRTHRFDEQLPDALGLIAGSLRAGYGLLQAVALVTEEMLPPASDEFRRLQTQARLGLPLESALDQMADRVDSEDFRWTVSAITIQREVGGNLAEVLDIVASTIREREALRRQVAGLTAEGRLSAAILLVLPFLEAAGLMLINPTYFLAMFGTPIGWALAGAAVVLMAVGALWMRTIVAIEV